MTIIKVISLLHLHLILKVGLCLVLHYVLSRFLAVKPAHAFTESVSCLFTHTELMLKCCACAWLNCFFALFLEFFVFEHFVNRFIWCFSSFFVVLIFERLLFFRWLRFCWCWTWRWSSKEVIKKTSFLFVWFRSLLNRSWFCLLFFWLFFFCFLFFKTKNILEQMSFFLFFFCFRSCIFLSWV